MTTRNWTRRELLVGLLKEKEEEKERKEEG